MPEQDSEHLTPATKLLEKRREMAEVEQALATQKEVSSVLCAPFNVVCNCLGVSNEDGDSTATQR